jgi:mannose-6-phosphate isomerase-like protein (cupin superfamily)
MMGRVTLASAEHYTWGNACDGWHLLQRGDLSVIQERVPPGAAESIHHHARARQFFFVLKGEGAMLMDGTEFVLPAGSGLEVPPGVPHQFCNRSGEDVAFLVISAPPSHGDRIEP